MVGMLLVWYYWCGIDGVVVLAWCHWCGGLRSDVGVVVLAGYCCRGADVVLLVWWCWHGIIGIILMWYYWCGGVSVVGLVR